MQNLSCENEFYLHERKNNNNKSKHISIIYKSPSIFAVLKLTKSHEKSTENEQGAIDIPPKIFTLFLVTSFRKGFTKEYAMGNSFGAVKEKSKATHQRNIVFIRESIRSQEDWLFPRVLKPETRNTTYGYGLCFSLTFYLLLGSPGCSSVPGLSRSRLDKISVC